MCMTDSWCPISLVVWMWRQDQCLPTWSTEDMLITNLILPQVNGEFAVDLFGELARAYLASTNTRSQVTLYRLMTAYAKLFNHYQHSTSGITLALHPLGLYEMWDGTYDFLLVSSKQQTKIAATWQCTSCPSILRRTFLVVVNNPHCLRECHGNCREVWSTELKD